MLAVDSPMHYGGERAPGSIQEKLRIIWADVLQDEPSSFGPDDVFFEVGGDSITAQRLIEAAAGEGIHLTMEQVFMHASLEDMAEIAQLVELGEPAATAERDAADQERLDAIAKRCHLPASSIESAYGLTPMQESLLVVEEDEDDGDRINAYVRQFVFRLGPEVDLRRLRRSWQETIRANAVLRTRICRVGGREMVQAVVREEAECVLWTTTDGSLRRFLAQDARTPMVVGGPFFRYAFVDEEEGARHFVWTAHHALCDGASLPEILADVASRFRGDFVPARPPFADFVQSSAVRPDRTREQQFWTQALAGTQPPPYPAVPDDDFAFRAQPNAVLDHELVLDQLPPFGTTKALLLRAAWAILLAHYTGSEEVGFGVINSGRTSAAAAVPGVARMTGPTINLVPVVQQVDPGEPVSALLARIRQQAAQTMPFEHTGLSRIRTFLASTQSTATSTATLNLQSLLVVHHASFGDAIAPSMQQLGLVYVDGLGKKEQHAFPLVLTCTLGARILLRIEHDERVVPAPQALRLAHHLQAVLAGLGAATADTPVAAISPLSAHDLQQIRQWNAATPPAEETRLHDLFARQVHQRPEAAAVCSQTRTLTYAEVDAASSSLAAQLAAQGVNREVFVGVCFDKSIWTVVAILAVFKAGGVYVPLDPTHPPGRLEEIVQMASIRVALTSPAGTMALSSLTSALAIIEVKDTPAPRPWTEPNDGASPSSTAYLLFTSGSTGKPKGILMSHRAICTSILHHGPAFGAGPHWRTLQFCAHTFDLSVAEFFTTLAFGGCVCVPSEADRAADLAGALATLQANTLIVVPTVANLLDPAAVAPTPLQTLILSGEPIPRETVVRWADHVALTCAYGPSETAVWCAAHLRVGRDAHPAHIGRSLGATMWIVDPEDHRRLAAVGCVGEIAISGALVGGGYLGDTATTDATFVAAPDWVGETGDGRRLLYRSGDLGRYNPDGTFHVVGRSDTQVKLRGLRIELGEIESRLTHGGLVTAALACLPPTGPAARRIVAVVSDGPSTLDSRADAIRHQPRHQAAALIATLQQRLQLTLPAYMVPSVWVVLDQMPLLVSGKMDRKRLKQWVQDMTADTYANLVGDPADGDSAVFPVLPGSLADQLRQLWSSVLQVPAAQIGLATSFFAVGGDSIAAIQIAAQARRTLPALSLSVRAIIGAQTLGNLAALVAGEKETAPVSLPASPPESVFPDADPDANLDADPERLAPYHALVVSRLAARPTIQVQDAHILSAFQREVLRARRANPAVFLMSWRMELWASAAAGRPLSLPRLAAAWRRTVAHFPVLRSVFLKDAPDRLGLPVLQVVLSPEAAAHAAVLVSEAAADAPEPGFADHEAAVPGVDAAFLPHRAHVIRHGDRVYLHVEMDHLIIDGWSLGLIKKALLTAYEAGTEAGSLYEGPVASYAAFVAAQTAPARVRADDAYWTRRLDGLSPSLLSATQSNTDPVLHQQPRLKKALLPLPPIAAPSLTPFGAAHGLTPASIFSAAWAQTLARFAGTRDVAFEYVVSGRDEDLGGGDLGGASVWDLMGCCINVLVHRTWVDDNDEDNSNGLARLAAQIQEDGDEGARHGASNVRDVADKMGPVRPFDTAVNFQRRPTAVENDARTLKVDDDLDRSKDPWHFNVLVRVLHITDDNAFHLSLEFFEQDYSRTAMQQVAEDWWQRVKNVADKSVSA